MKIGPAADEYLSGKKLTITFRAAGSSKASYKKSQKGKVKALKVAPASVESEDADISAEGSDNNPSKLYHDLRGLRETVSERLQEFLIVNLVHKIADEEGVANQDVLRDTVVELLSTTCPQGISLIHQFFNRNNIWIFRLHRLQKSHGR